MPIIGVALLALVTIWPRVVPLLESVRFGFPVIDLREAHELRMLNPRYAGVDRENRPYVVTSAIGRQASDRDDLMSLERPRAEMTMHNGALVVVTAATAMYQSQAQLLDLFGDVNLVHENGTRFVTSTAHVDVAADTAGGNDPVSGHGPSGDITAQGFRVLDRGNMIVFTGKSNLLLKGTKPSAHPAATPPMLPAEVAETAAALEAAAVAPEAIVPGAIVPGASALETPVAANPVPTLPAAKPDPAVQSHSLAKREAKPPPAKALVGVRAKRDAS
ncbi:MAG: LPS export ABC transporter periplasmic protein LptC [Alphaproteobacteria bacterium]|nr:LPS export ABC transporter periplasmic protein LptC [Alphaproteobacteria bacterium]